jgi:hypothetical protein
MKFSSVLESLTSLSISACLLFSVFSCSDYYDEQKEFFERVQVEAQKLRNELIGDFSVNSNLESSWTLIGPGSKMYTDRSYTYTAVPEVVLGNLAFQPANDDKFFSETDPPYLSFRLKKKATVYVVYTNLSTNLVLRWLNENNGWKDEEFTIGTTLWSYKSLRFVKSQTFPENAEVKLGGNGCTQDNCDMYTVIIAPFKNGEEGDGIFLGHGVGFGPS